MDKQFSPLDWRSLSPGEIEKFLTDAGQPRYRAKQIFRWLMKGRDFDGMTDLPAALRARLKEAGGAPLPAIVNKQISKIDGTRKYLLELRDGECVETVLMKYEHGNTVCVSSQAGCRMGCAFCASHRSGFVRSLTAGEMVVQVLTAAADSGEKVDNIVLMGIGEPLDNYEAVISFLKLIHHPDGLGIGWRHISLSTCGIVPGIDRLADEGLPITLSVSLHAPDDGTRSAIMPVNRRWPIDRLMAACRRYFEKTGRRISFEYALIEGVNDSPAGAAELAAMLKAKLGDMPVHVNLIPVNEVKETAFRKSGSARVAAFADLLNSRGITATVRRKLGADIDAACGQLRARHAAGKKE